jgi:multicomponent Na+:H+ antiporter subunit D
MPWTTAFCIVGAASISAFPLFSGFVSKSLIIAAALEDGYFWTWLILLFASAGVFHHSGIKIPYFAFFAHDSGKRCAEAPPSMLVAMALTALLCIGIGVWPAPLYAILPFKIDFVAYTVEHVVTQMQLLMFSALAFTFLMRTGLYPPELRSVNLDTDWFYRRAGQAALNGVNDWSARLWNRLVSGISDAAARTNDRLRRHYTPAGTFGGSWPTGTMAFWTTFLLVAFLLIAAAS